MSRTIKFRVWLPEEKRMKYDVGDNPGDYLYFRQPCVSYLMQYIGIQDIHGKDIYEGDTIKGFLYGDTVPIIGEVMYCTESDCFSYGEITGSWVLENEMVNYLLKDLREIEVLGNKYENPDLLELNDD